MNQYIAFVEVDDLSLAAALFTMGYKPVEGQAFVKYAQPGGKSKFKFFLEATQGIQDFIQAWKTEGWENLSENSEKDFAFIKCFHNNRNKLLDIVKETADTAIINSNGRTGILGRKATEDTKTLVFNKL